MTTWVLLRGLMRESRHWGEFPLLFKNTVEAQQVLTLDFPGNGKLHAQASPTRVPDMAEYCHAQLRQLGYPPPYRVLALSLGAMVALAWSELHPADIEKMVLIDTSLAPYSPFYQRLFPGNYPALVRRLLFGSATQRENLILQLTSRLQNQPELREAILGQWTAYASEYPVTRANMLRQLWAAASYRPSLSAPANPVLLLAAQQDQLVNANCSLSLAQHWRCPLRVHPTAGHDIPLDDGLWVAQQIREWLN
jgi:pimeloyl-ACP methyl ester carboxylesterase